MINYRKCIYRILYITINIVLILMLLFLVVLSIPNIMTISKYNSVEERFSVISSPKHYVFIDDVLPDQMYENFNKETATKLLEALNIFNKDTYVMYGYSPDIIDNRTIQCRVANHSFFDLHRFDVESGRMFTKKDFDCSNDSIIPILVGNNLKDYYKLGETYSFYHGDEAKQYTAVVIGILKDGTTYPSLIEIEESLDDSYIIPLNYNFVDCYFGVSDFDMAISSAIVKTENPEMLDAFCEIADTSKMFSIEYMSVEQALQEYESNIIVPGLTQIKLFLGIIFLLLIIFSCELAFMHSRKKRQH